MSMLKETDILYENGKHWVIRARGQFEVYKLGITGSIRVAQISESLGLQRAIDECNRREMPA